MRIRATVSIIAILSLLCSNASFACSAFLLKGDSYTVIGFNENWSYIPGIVVVNKRGIHKRNLSWSHLVESSSSKPELTWTSKYGSVTTTVLGLDLPCYGMNERGLFVVELSLDKTFSQADPARPNMFWGQWIQYQLDNYATVREVAEHVNSGPVIDWWPHADGSHFFVSDAAGNTGAIEFIEGKPVVYDGGSMPIPALNNDTYPNETARLADYDGFGGTKKYDMKDTDWDNRFIKLAHGLKYYTPAADTPIGYAWKMLDGVHPGVWQFVGDVRQRVIYFKTKEVGKIKSIDLKRLDFSPGSPVLFVDLNLNAQGDITEALQPWTPGINRAYVMVGFPLAYTEPFYNTPAYEHLLQNLDTYAGEIQQQTTPGASKRQDALLNLPQGPGKK